MARLTDQAGRSVRQARQLEPGSSRQVRQLKPVPGRQVSLTGQAAEARPRQAGQLDRSGS